MSSLPSQIKNRIRSSDVVLLVDSAKNPMQATSLSVLRSLAASGHIDKLRICFTHLDELKGDNLPNRKARIKHVSSSLNQAISHIRDTLGYEVATSLDTRLPEISYYVANIDEPLGKDKYTHQQLIDLLNDLEMSRFTDKYSNAVPFYDEANLVISVQNATRRFFELWKARLGFPSVSTESAEHWTRVKAISRRLALDYDNGEYDNMRPVSELSDYLMEHIRVFLNQPLNWVPTNVSDEEKRISVDIISSEIDSKLLEFATKRVWVDRKGMWIKSYNHSGIGSVNRRKNSIYQLLELAAPIPGEAATVSSHDYLLSVRQLVKASILTKGGKLHQ